MGACVALIVAAGRGARFGGDRPKQYAPLAGRSVLRTTIEAFRRHPAVSWVAAVIQPDDRPLYDAATAGLGDVAEPVAGGATRQESVRLGLEALAPWAPEAVLIHDAARPLVGAAVIDRVRDGLRRGHAAVLPALPVTDTLKRADAAGGRVTGTVARAGLYRAQTPQGFRFDAILAAHRAQRGAELTDDAAVAEAAGLEVALVEGDERNLKVTTGEDLRRATLLMNGALLPCTGTGFDVHRFGPGDGVVGW